MSLAHSKKIVTDGLVLCLDALNPDSYPGSGTDWNSLVGNISGSLTNGPTFDGKSIVFDGVDDGVTTGQPILESEFTVDTWFKVNALNDFEQWIITQYTGGESGRLLINVQNNTSPNNRIRYFLGSIKTITSTTQIEPGTYYNVTCTKTTSGIVELYINSELENSKTGAVVTIPAVDFNLGDTVSSRALNGNIAKVSVYNRALSQQEIKQNYNALKQRYR